MKKIIISIFSLGLLLCIHSNAFAQAADVKSSEEYQRQMKIYQDALKYNDVAVAKHALYNLRAIDPSNGSLLDSLAYFYFEYQQWASSLLVARDILAQNSNHLPALEIQAVSYEKLGVYDKSLSAYESLYLKRENPTTLYKIAMLQFDLKRHNESKTSLDILLNDKKIDEMKVLVNEDGKQQKEIPMKAALLNFQGMNYMELGNKEAAKENFEAALKLAPEYAMAKENLGKI